MEKVNMEPLVEPHPLTELNGGDMRIMLLMEEAYATPKQIEQDKLKCDDISISIAIERHESEISDIKAQLCEIYSSIEFSY
jgi:uncharacterized protein YdaU (DUF1376 family)